MVLSWRGETAVSVRGDQENRTSPKSRMRTVYSRGNAAMMPFVGRVLPLRNGGVARVVRQTCTSESL